MQTERVFSKHLVIHLARSGRPCFGSDVIISVCSFDRFVQVWDKGERVIYLICMSPEKLAEHALRWYSLGTKKTKGINPHKVLFFHYVYYFPILTLFNPHNNSLRSSLPSFYRCGVWDNILRLLNSWIGIQILACLIP